MNRDQLLALMVFGVVVGGGTLAYSASGSMVLSILVGLGIGFALVLVDFARSRGHRLEKGCLYASGAPKPPQEACQSK
jgi:hypothetical protein